MNKSLVDVGSSLVCDPFDASGFRNDPDALRNLANRRLTARRLRCYGIAFAGAEALRVAGNSRPWLAQDMDHRYRVPVFQCEALAVLRPGEEALAPELAGGAPQPALARKLGRYAVRAVYAAGLDYGCVQLRLVDRNTAQVLAIDPAPREEGRMAEMYAAAFSRFAARLRAEDAEKPEVVLGADPEFLLLSERGKVVPASRFLSRGGAAGCDSRTAGPGRDVLPLAELRPDPSGDPATLIRNLRRAMWAASARIPDRSLRWLAGGMPVPGLPLGGHVHLSGICPTNALIRALDNFLALPLALIEDRTTAMRRKRYGRLGDVRLQRHGGFEYRTLPSWILSPSVAKGVIALAKIIAAHYRELGQRPLDDVATLEAYVAGDKTALEDAVRAQWRTLEALDGYRTYAKYLDPLKARIMARRSWDEQRDFRVHWRIPPFH